MVFGREPVVFLGMLLAVLQVGVGFGLDLTNEQQGLLMAAATAVVAFCTRQSVKPVPVSSSK